MAKKRKKRRKSEKMADANHVRTLIGSTKNEIACLIGKGDCNNEHRLKMLQNVTLPKLQRRLGSLEHSHA